MKKAITGVRRFVGLDVHSESIAAAIAEKDQVARDLGTIPNREESVRKLVKKLSEGGTWAACYEAGPTGYALYWQLTKLGIPRVVVAPTLVPTKPGDRVKKTERGVLTGHFISGVSGLACAVKGKPFRLRGGGSQRAATSIALSVSRMSTI